MHFTKRQFVRIRWYDSWFNAGKCDMTIQIKENIYKRICVFNSSIVVELQNCAFAISLNSFASHVRAFVNEF